MSRTITTTIRLGDRVHFRFGSQSYGYGTVDYISGLTAGLRYCDSRGMSTHANEPGSLAPVTERLCAPVSSLVKWGVGGPV